MPFDSTNYTQITTPAKNGRPRKLDMLPEKLSDCVDLAVTDLKKAAADSRVILDMSTWYTIANKNKEHEHCAVCVAGAVMRYSLKGLAYERVHSGVVRAVNISALSPHNKVRVAALNDVRAYSLMSAIDKIWGVTLQVDRDVTAITKMLDRQLGENNYVTRNLGTDEFQNNFSRAVDALTRRAAALREYGY